VITGARFCVPLLARRHKETAIIGLLVIAMMVGGREGGGGERAAFLRVRYVPVENSIESIPVADIDRSWSRVLVLRKSNQPADVLTEVEANEGLGARFSADGDFNRDGRPDKVLVGVYEEKSGATGRFFLILTEVKAQLWRKSFLAKFPGESAFSILFVSGETVDFAACLWCDDGLRLVWARGGYALRR
jgi:hypothetical protein